MASQQIDDVVAEVCNYIDKFHIIFGTDGKYNTGYPDERGISDQLLFMIKRQVTLDNKKLTFTAGAVESIEGHDYTIEFSLTSPGNIGRRFTLFLQAKNLQKDADERWYAEFTDGRVPAGDCLQANKLHKKITDVIKEKEGVDGVHINGGYILYGPSTLGIIYAPIGLVKGLYAKHHDEEKASTDLNKEITLDILQDDQDHQFRTILTDNTPVRIYKDHFYIL